MRADYAVSGTLGVPWCIARAQNHQQQKRSGARHKYVQSEKYITQFGQIQLYRSHDFRVAERQEQSSVVSADVDEAVEAIFSVNGRVSALQECARAVLIFVY